MTSPLKLWGLFRALRPHPAAAGGSARALCLERSGKGPCRRRPGGGGQRGPLFSPAARLQIEQVSQLSALVDAQLDYHRQAVQILDELANKLKRR